MKSYKNIYPKIYDLQNLLLAYKKARKGKRKKKYVIEFHKNLADNLIDLNNKLKDETYAPSSLKSFVLMDPKKRVISKSEFKDRIVHHAICNILEPIFQKTFIYDSCANQKGKGTLFAVKRFERYKRKVTFNLSKKGFCLKCDIKKYFENVDRERLLIILMKKINCQKTMNLIFNILNNFEGKKGMPLGNLTSQFFANVYLNELDQFIKHKLNVAFYIRYVDDFIILNSSKEKLKKIKIEISLFLIRNLKLELHEDKTKILSLSNCVDFVGFRNYYFHRLLRKRNIKSFKKKVHLFYEDKILEENFKYIVNGWYGYAKWSNCYNLNKNLIFKRNNFLKHL